MKKRPVLLIGSYGRGNVGDDMFLSAAVSIFDGRQIYINSANDSILPPDVVSSVKTISTSFRRDLIKKVKVFRNIGHIIYWGGDVWVKYYDDKFPRQPLYKMLIVNMLARLFRKKVHYVGCGLGDLHGYDLMLARCSARLSDTIITREQRSAAMLNLNHVKTLPDLATTIPYYSKSIKTIEPYKKFVIGISILYFIPNPETEFDKLTDEISSFLNELDTAKFKIVLFPMLTSDRVEKDDVWAISQLKLKLHNNLEIEILKANSLSRTIDSLQCIDLMIGTRLHANILATFSAVPSLGISYRPKVNSFFRDNGLEEFCLDIHDLSNLKSVFLRMYNNYEDIARRFSRVSKKNIKQGESYRDFANNIE